MKNKKTKKILINAVSAKMGGALTYLTNLIKELKENSFGNQYFVCISSQIASMLPATSGCDWVKIIPIDFSGQLFFKKLWWNQVGIRKIIKQYNIDILFSSANFATLFCPVKQLLLVRWYLSSAPYFGKHILARYPPKDKLKFYLRQFFIYISAKRADKVMFPSQSKYDEFQKLYNFARNKLSINHYGIYPERFSKEADLREKEFQKRKTVRILYATMYNDHKNFSTVFKALKILKNQKINFQFITPAVFDDKYAKAKFNYEEENKLLNNPIIKENIILTGKIPYFKIDRLYKRADIFLWATLTESFGHHLLEAMASNLPIIASDIPINREICKEAAIFFDPLSEQDLVDKIKLVLSDKKLRENLMFRAQKRVKKFTWLNHIKNLNLIFETMLEA